MSGTRLGHRLGDIAVTICAKSLRGVPLETDLQGGMSLMATTAISVVRLLTVTEMTAETGRHSSMAPMASNTITVMSTSISNKLRFDLWVTTGTDRTTAAHLDQIIL